jgi:CHAT domain-containing protein/Tfp pilus assembly protein PilF
MAMRFCLRALAAALVMTAVSLAGARQVNAQTQAPDEQRWQLLYATLEEARDKADYAGGARRAEEALGIARKTFGDRAEQTLNTINALGSFYDLLGRYREAARLFEEAAKTGRATLGPRHLVTLSSVSGLALTYLRLGRYGEAEPLYKETLQQKRDAQGRLNPNTLGAIGGLAELYRVQGRHGEAEPLYKKALQISRVEFGPRHPGTLAVLGNLAMLYYATGRYGEAEQSFNEALQAEREVLGPRHPNTVASINGLALVYLAEGRYAEAEPLYKEALQAARAVLGPRHANTLVVLDSFAMLYRAQGRYGEAEPLSKEALQARRATLGPRHPDTITSLNNLASLYAAQGRYDEAEPLLQEVLQTNREVLGPRHPHTVSTLQNLAAVNSGRGRDDAAEPLIREALQTNREILGPRHPETLLNLDSLALLSERRGGFAEAEPLFREALQTRREVLGSRHPDTLTSLVHLATFYDARGRRAEAEPLLQEAAQTSREVLGPRHPETLKIQLVRAIFQMKQDQRAEAVRTLQEMEPNILGWIGQELHSTQAGIVRRQLVSSQASFQDVVLTLATAGGISDAAVRSDARRLAATVMLRFKLLQGEEEAYLARLARRSPDPRVHALVNDIGGLRATLAAAAEGATKTPDAYEKTLQALEGKRRALIDASPEYKDRLRALNASLDDVRKALPAGAVLIEFRQFLAFDLRRGPVGAPRFAALLLTGSGEPAVVDLGPVSELQSLATEMDAPAAPRGLAPNAMGLDDPAAAKLYERLFARFKDAVVPANTVYVAPDGILNLIPFMRLRLADGRYWFERQEVHVLQTGRDLLRPATDHTARGLLALGGIDFGAAPVGDSPQDSMFFAAAGADRSAAVTRAAQTFHAGFGPLPATADEVKQVAKWFRTQHTGEPAEIWSGAEASKARLMALKTPPRVLHLATHGFYLPSQSREPMLLSGIALAGANREVGGTGRDGLLFALEAEGLNLDGTELVVLSACDTAQGAVDYSEGVFGLARALRTAGARSVLVTLWPLDDGEARDFMADFYRNWSGPAHSDPAKALRDTQLQWIGQTDRGNPRAWAPYVLIE